MQCKCSRTSYVLAARCATLVALVTGFSISSKAHAQQFVLVDQTYTADKDNTQDSHFTAEIKSGIPTNLKSPTNYAGGSVHVTLDMQETPSDADGLYNICLENSSDVACLPYVKYKGKGKVEDNPKFSLFWQNEKVDWTKGVTKVSLIIKDSKEAKVQGSAMFYPYKAHVTLTVVAEGATFDPDGTDSGAAGGSAMSGQAGKAGSSSMSQGGKGGAGKGSTSSNQGGEGGMPAKGGTGGAKAGAGVGGAGVAGTGATSSPSTAAGTGGATKPAQAPSTAGTSSTPTSRVGVSSGAAGTDDGPQSVSSQLEDTSGCSVGYVGARNAWSAWPLLALGLLAARRRKRAA